MLCQLAPDDATLVADYGRRSRELHAPWEPIRSSDFWDEPVVAQRLAGELEEAVTDRGLTLYLMPRGEQRRVIGRLVLLRIVRGSLQSCHLGYGLAPEAVGRGLMAEAVRAATRIAFEELALHRIEANIVPRNERSIALIERCGFTYEGVSRDCYRIAGRWEDHARYSLLAGDVS